MNVKHEVHQFGFRSERRLPIMLITRAPGPANGAAHSRQRGLRGISLKSRRPIRSLGEPCVRNSRQNSSVSAWEGSLEVMRGSTSVRPRKPSEAEIAELAQPPRIVR
jgi:hypothetical protein